METQNSVLIGTAFFTANSQVAAAVPTFEDCAQSSASGNSPAPVWSHPIAIRLRMEGNTETKSRPQPMEQFFPKMTRGPCILLRDTDLGRVMMIEHMINGEMGVFLWCNLLCTWNKAGHLQKTIRKYSHFFSFATSSLVMEWAAINPFLWSDFVK